MTGTNPVASPEHVRRSVGAPSGSGLTAAEQPAEQPAELTASEIADALLNDRESLARLADAVGDAVERKIIRDLVRQGRTGYPGLV